MAVQLLLCVVIAIAHVASAMPLSLLKHRSRELSTRFEAPEPSTLWWDQKVDHFEYSAETWKQRYWLDKTFCLSSSCHVFVYVGGEGALNGYSVTAGEHVELAQHFGAAVLSVEHRFYGASLPRNSLSTENLRLLSSQQALADLVTVVQGVRAQHQLEGGKVVTFGGSYPGALSAWARSKYPHIVHAAVSTSSPVRAELDFSGYCRVVSDALVSPVAGGSQACFDSVARAFKRVHDLLHTSAASRQQLDELLHSCKPLSDSDKDAFAAVSQWAGEVMGLVQYNRLKVPAGEDRLNVARFCQNMTTAPSGQELETLVQLFTSPDSSCVGNTWEEQMVPLLNTTADPAAQGVGIRQWVYQTASQFAYYQTCETNCPFAADMDLNGYAKQCQEAYGVPETETADSVAFTNTYYGSNATAVDRTFFVNGGLDPWHVLSVQTPLPNDVRSVVINGTSHCRQMAPSQPDDPPQVVQARKQVQEALTEWLQ